MNVHQKISTLAAALAMGMAGASHAGVIGSWDFDTAWASGTTDTSGYGGGWVARAGSFNSMSMDYVDASTYGRTGGVAKITNNGTDNISRFAGVRLLLVDGAGSPNSDGYAFREAFEASMHKSLNPYVQVDMYDGLSQVIAGLFAYSIKPTDPSFNFGSYNRIATTSADWDILRAFEDAGATTRGTTARTLGWQTLLMELGSDGYIDYLVNGVQIGTSANQYGTLTSAYNSAFSLLVAGTGGQSAVFDNFSFGNNPIPEPGSLALLGLGLAGLAGMRRRKA